jgi:hypothetical protein
VASYQRDSVSWHRLEIRDDLHVSHVIEGIVWSFHPPPEFDRKKATIFRMRGTSALARYLLV